MEKNLLALKELRQIAQKMRTSGLRLIELNGKAWSVRLKFDETCAQLPPTPQPVLSATDVAPTRVCAPMPGKIILQHPLQNVAYAQPGQTVKQDEVLALLSVGGFYLPLRSPINGTVLAVSVDQEQAVEYGCEIVSLSASAGVFA